MRVTGMRPMETAVARNLLRDCNTYHIEFQGYLSNHVKHAVIALDRLHASPDRIQEYYTQYCTMTPYNLPLERLSPLYDGNNNPDQATPQQQQQQQVNACSLQDFQNWRGKKQHWPEQLHYMQQQLEEMSFDTDALVQRYVPALLPGMAGSLTHGIIHLGWAIDADSPEMIAEGIAYLNYCYLSTEQTDLQWDKHHATAAATATTKALSAKEEELPVENHPMESLIRVAKTFQALDLGQEWILHAKTKFDESFHPELVCAGFQWQLAKVMATVHPVATNLPTWLTTTNEEDDNDNSKSAAQLFEGLYYTVTWLYLATRTDAGQDGGHHHGNFLMLHLITALWGVEHVCQALLRETPATSTAETTNNNHTITTQALAHYYVMLICLIATAQNGFLTVETLQQVQEEFPKDQVDSVDYDWTDTVNRAHGEVEEHNIKLVYVMKELWNRYGRWRGFSEAAKSFTPTPDIGPTSTTFNAEK